MAESGPGDDGDHESRAAITDSSPDSQPSSLHMKEGSFKKTVTSHPLAETFQCVNGLEFHIRGLEEKCPSFTYASLPGVSHTPLEWKICCEPDQDVGGEYVTYHKLTDSDDSLSAVMAKYTEPNIVGLIIINTCNSTILSSDFINNAASTPPVYIISLGDGEKLRAFVNAHDEGAVQIKVYVESTVDTVSTPVVSTGLYLPLSNSNGAQSKLDLHSPYNLREELKKVLFVHKKERVHACANHAKFNFSISCFHNYEVQTRRESPDKAIKMLGNFTEQNFKKDFLFYLLLAHRFVVYHDIYGDSNVINSYVKLCIEKFEAMNDVQAMANVILTFIESGDFSVQFNHGHKSDVSVFQLLYHTASVMLKKSNKVQTKTHKINIYCRILWIALVIYFGLQVNVPTSVLTPLWKTDLLNEQVQKELAFSDDIIREFSRGFELLRALRLSEGVYFLPSELAIFLNPLKMKTLHISHITQLLNTGQHYLNWNLKSLCHILPPLRSNYDAFLNRIEIGWTTYSKDGTKIGVYKEALNFLECIYNWIPKSNKNDDDDDDDDDDGWENVTKSRLEKWIELLVDHVDMSAHDAMDYVKLLRSQNGLKNYKKFISGKIQIKGMKMVAELTMPQFATLFISSLFWRSEFVEAFLNYYNVPKNIDLKNSSWKLLLEEIIARFSDANCKKLIVGLIGRISKAYKSAGKQDIFVLDLAKMDVPNLLLVESRKESDTNVENLFIDMICAFIQRNVLREVILGQIPAIMKLIKPDNHFHSLILTVIQKEAVPDSKMLEKLHLTNHLKLVINESITAACNSLTALSQLSEADKFYWHFIASCCNHVQPNRENLAKVNTYLYPINKLSIIFHEYCTKNSIEKSIIDTVPQEISLILNANVKDYFNWIVKMQEIMIHWQSKFMDQDFNYDDTFTYTGNLQSIAAFAKAVCTEHLVYTADEIAKLKEDYSAIYAKLCLLLVKSNKEYGWCTLVEIFSSYGIRFSHTLQTKLDTHLVLPEGGPVVVTDDMQQILNQPNGQLELEPEMILRLKKSVTWKILQEIFIDLQLFLEPVMSHLEFLVYFHLHKCDIFSKHLKSQMDKLTANSEEPVELPAMKLAIPSVCTTQSSSNRDEKLLQFATALQSTRDFILSLIKGTAKYAEIFAEGLLQEELIQKFGTESEFRIMCAFPEFQEISAANEEGKEGIKHMLELFQYSEQISVIPKVCSQYQLDQCSKDPKLKELMDIVNSIKTAEDRDNVTGKIANHHMKKIWEILKFDDTSIAKKCLKIFPAVANCAAFYQFIQNKGFANDTSAFRAKVELITAQLQHEDYNETVLNHLMPAFQCICPFIDKQQSLGDMMNKIIKLYHDGVGFHCDPLRDFCQLEIVNSNIRIIQLWFFRTEEYCIRLIQVVRDQEKKAAEVLQSQLLQLQNKVDELTKELTMERSVTENAKSEIENLTKQLHQSQNEKKMIEQQILQAQFEKELENIKKIKEVVDLGVEIGRGSYGFVKKVSFHGTICAAKDIHSILINYASDKELKRITKSFLEECVKCSKLFHPNLVQFLGIYYPSKQAKLPWLVMELLDCSLTGFVEKYDEESVPLFVKASMFCDISLGLRFLHDQDIIHRDLSSNNILLTKHLTAKIADLGMAKLIDPDGSRSHTLAPGTKTFLPPEVFSVKPHYGKPVDVFSLGCIMMHVITHQWPDPADETHYDEALGRKVVLSEIARRKVYLNTIQKPIKSLILSYIHDSPKQRPEIAMVVAELQQLKTSCQKPISFNVVEFESHLKLQQKTNEQLLKKQRETHEQLLEKQRELAKIKTLQENSKRL